MRWCMGRMENCCDQREMFKPVMPSKQDLPQAACARPSTMATRAINDRNLHHLDVGAECVANVAEGILDVVV